jgi:putative hemolysin
MTDQCNDERIFSIGRDRRPGTPGDGLFRLAERLLGLDDCRAVYSRVADRDDTLSFLRAVLGELDVHAAVNPRELDRIPATGPAVVVANHPYGGIEGILLASLLLAVRPDVRVMANYLLDRVPQMSRILIPVDPFNRRGAPRANLKPVRDALRWVRGGGMLMVFPSGEVSHLRLDHGRVCDPAWNVAVGGIARRAGADVLPVFIHGRNSAVFQAAGLVHPRLRTAMLAREMLNKRGRSIALRIGSPIPHARLAGRPDDRSLVEYLRWRTYLLGCAGRRPPKRPALPIPGGGSRMRPIAPAQDRCVLQSEIAALPADRVLAQSGAFTVRVAEAAEIPGVLLEIGRLREITFRAASEGTGRSRDLDRFDGHYRHLFIWNETAAEIVGAYRLGPTDVILARHGRRGLYTSTLFHSRPELFKRLGPALELGRSFVRPEYQRSFSALLLLWKGIGSFVARHPRYRMLFGPVSVSRDYSDLSRHLIASTLLRHSQARELALLVRPRTPAPFGPVHVPGCEPHARDIQPADFKEMCELVADIELDRRDVPVLLRQYLNLGGQLLAFTIDRRFGQVMDGLIVVDLLGADRRTLQRYMGAVGAQALEAYHGHGAATGASEVRLAG